MRVRLGNRGSRMRRTSVIAALATAVATVAIGYTPAAAVTGPGLFELDRNAVHDASATPPYDWAQLQSACDVNTCASGVVAATGVVGDLPGATGDTTYFTGGGSKDNNDITQWGNGGAGAPDKNELDNAYAAAMRDSSKHLIVFTGADRYDNSGAAEMGFWLFKNTVRTGTGAMAGKFVDANNAAVSHSVGDVLILSDFTIGGSIGEIVIYKWVGSGGDSGGGTLQQVAKSTTADCTTQSTTLADDYCATINQNTTPDAPWAYQFKGLGSVTKFQPRTFLEGGVNVGNLGLGDCFGSYLAETRTAPEIKGAELKDYALGDFPVCEPTTTMKNTPMSSDTTSSMAHLNQTVTYTAYEKNDGTDPLSSPSVSGTGCTTWTHTAGSGDTTNVGVLDPGEQWTFTCSTSYSTAGPKTVTVFGHGLDPLFGNKDVTYCASRDTTKICDADETNTISITVISPSTTMAATPPSVSPSLGIVHVGDNVVYTFYEKNDGDVVLTPSVSTDDTANCATATPKNKPDDISTPLVDESLYNVGDANNNGSFDPTEEWAFTCTTQYASAGSGTINAIGHGVDPLGADVTYYQVAGSDCTAGAIVSGKLCDLQEQATKSVTVINPGTTLKETVSAVVTFTYYETNSGDSVIHGQNITSDCAGSGTATEIKKAQDPSTSLDETLYNAGDNGVAGVGANDGIFQNGETWQFKCTKTLSLSTTDASTDFTDNAVGHGLDAANSAVPDTNEKDSSKVVLTNNVPN